MKKIGLMVLLGVTLAFPALAGDELFIDSVFVKVSVYTPYQMPIPWFYYVEDAYLWGEYSVYGVDLGLPWSASKDVFGLGTGIYLDYSGCTAGLSAAIAQRTERLFGVQAGVYNYAETLCGIQVGVVNDCTSAYGIQVGVVNVIRTSPLTWFPILNAHF